MGDVFASPNGKFQAVLEIEQCDSTIAFNLRANDSSHRRTKSLSIERQRSFYIVHLDGDAWFHFISTVPPTRMKEKKIEISTHAQHDTSSLAGC